MFSAVRRRVTYANVVVTIALVFAMAGGAYAAKKYLITSTKQISPSVLKSLVGKAGAQGSQGPAGPAGSQGPAGPSGKDGAAGSQGSAGKEGPAGKEGAAGKEGKEGKEGSPWTAGGTLPSGKVETGQWVVSSPEGKEHPLSELSFPIPLKVGVAEENIHFLEFPNTSPECPGSVLEPTVAPAPGPETPVLCIYGAPSMEGIASIAYFSFSGAGVVMTITRAGGAGGTSHVWGYGAFAVTEG